MTTQIIHATALPVEYQEYTPVDDFGGYAPFFAPVGGSNKRQARCAECRKVLAAGTAYAWDYSDEIKGYSPFAHRTYYCKTCHEYQLALLAIQPEVKQAMAEIEAWLDEHKVRSVSARIDIDLMVVGPSGLHAADVARGIADRLQCLPRDRWNYAGIMNLAWSVKSALVY